MQQGRVQVDADWNAQHDLLDHRRTTEAIDVIGREGAPKEGGGFELRAEAGPLSISTGRYYLEGELLENAADTPFTAQPYLPNAVLPAAAGSYLFYLEAFERGVSADQDPSIRDAALGGADTTIRAQLVWQVKHLRLGGPNPAVAADAGAASLALLRTPMSGRLNARAVAVAAQDRPCLVPSGARFRRLDNLLYRVEIHEAPNGTQAGATFKWSRDNGAFSTAITPLGGARFQLDEASRDDWVGFAQNAWVEIIDERMELTNGVGLMRRIAQPVDQERREVVLDQDVVGLQPNARMRLWSHTTGASLPMVAGWNELEAGIQISFADGTYRPGDFWLIPARAALVLADNIVAGTGDIEWPQDAAGPVSQAPHGTRHFFSGLALFDFDGAAWTRRHDLRKLFPPLTAIEASDVSFDNSEGLLEYAPTVQDAIEELARGSRGHCTIVLAPADDLLARLQALDPGQSASICFQVGTFDLPDQITFANLGHLKVEGSGPGTLLRVGGAECALRFQTCSSVQVCNLSVETGIGQGSGRTNLRGGLHFIDCPEVTVESVHVKTRGQPETETAALTVRTASSVRIRGCRLDVGRMQHGILCIDTERVSIEDNEVIGRMDEPLPPWSVRRDSQVELARRRRKMISHAQLGPRTELMPSSRVEVRWQDFAVTFVTPSALRTHWPRLVEQNPPRAINSSRELLRWVKLIAETLLKNNGVLNGYRGMRGWFLDEEDELKPVGKRAIIVAGMSAMEVRISKNRIEQFIGGVHVGVSNGDPRSVSVGALWIEDNRISLWTNNEKMQDRFGIFVSSALTARVVGNCLSLGATEGSNAVFEGIRLYGIFGQMVQVRDNDVRQFDVAIRFNPFLVDALPRTQWIFTDNLFQTRAGAVFGPTATSSSAIAAKVRGEEFNVNV
jgi:hypothetical protein